MRENLKHASKMTEILLTEYRELFQEIRNIHDKRITLFKMIVSALIAIISYAFAGMLFYMQSHSSTGSEKIPYVLVIAYSLLGIILALGAYQFLHNSYYHIGTSKKHTVRNWKAIHAIRYGFKELYPELKPYLIMQDSHSNPDRPRLSKRWNQGIFIYPLYHVMFYLILGLLICPLFADFEADKGLVIEPANTEILKKALILLWPLLIIRLSIGCNAMRRFWFDIQKARTMRADNFFPEDKPQLVEAEEDPAARAAKQRPSMIRKLIWYGHFALILISLCLAWLYFSLGKEPGHKLKDRVSHSLKSVALPAELAARLANLEATHYAKTKTVIDSLDAYLATLEGMTPAQREEYRSKIIVLVDPPKTFKEAFFNRANLLDGNYWKLIITGFILLAICGELLYLNTYDLKVSLTLKEGKVEISFD